jgi:hypothetical protein
MQKESLFLSLFVLACYARQTDPEALERIPLIEDKLERHLTAFSGDPETQHIIADGYFQLGVHYCSLENWSRLGSVIQKMANLVSSLSDDPSAAFSYGHLLKTALIGYLKVDNWEAVAAIEARLEALADAIPEDRKIQRLAYESFAISEDIYLIKGKTRKSDESLTRCNKIELRFPDDPEITRLKLESRIRQLDAIQMWKDVTDRIANVAKSAMHDIEEFRRQSSALFRDDANVT